MRKVGLTLLRDTPDSALCAHFGQAKWLNVRTLDDDAGAFTRNTERHGRDVARFFRQQGCTDVIVRHLGEGALRHLHEANISVWLGEDGIPAPRLLEALEAGALERLERAS